MTQAPMKLDIKTEVASITATLAARRDPAYMDGMRRTVPSSLPAHATRVPEMRKTANEWSRAHRGNDAQDVIGVAEALWATGWREEMLVAIALLKPVLAAVEWGLIERWSAQIENWEQVDHFADVTGEMLLAERGLLAGTKRLEVSEQPWQRRLALVTLIYAFRHDPSWRAEVESMSGRLSKDKHPLVRKAVAWARDRLKKGNIDGR